LIHILLSFLIGFLVVTILVFLFMIYKVVQTRRYLDNLIKETIAIQAEHELKKKEEMKLVLGDK